MILLIFLNHIDTGNVCLFVIFFLYSICDIFLYFYFLVKVNSWEFGISSERQPTLCCATRAYTAHTEEEAGLYIGVFIPLFLRLFLDHNILFYFRQL